MNDRSTSMCILSAKVVNLSSRSALLALGQWTMKILIQIFESLSLLLNVREKEPTNHNKDCFFIGNLMSWINLKTAQLHVCLYQLHTAIGPSITLEVAFFLFLFSQGNGAYKGRISIHDYLPFFAIHHVWAFVHYDYLTFWSHPTWHTPI
jgi:hypothetical protein